MNADSIVAKLRASIAELVISDPWELVNESGENRFRGAVVEVDAFAEGAETERVLLELKTPVHWHGAQFRYLVAEPRHSHGMVDDLLEGRTVESCVIGVSDDQVASGSPWGADKWRGGLAATTQLTIIAKSQAR